MNKEININIDTETLGIALGAMDIRRALWQNTARSLNGELMEEEEIVVECDDVQEAQRTADMYAKAHDNLERAMRHRTMYQGIRRKLEKVMEAWRACNHASVPADLRTALGTSIDMYQQEAEEETNKTTPA